MNKVLCFLFLFINTQTFSQKFGYVNSEFILKSMKEYKEATQEIENLSKAWEKEINDMYIEIEKKEIENLSKAWEKEINDMYIEIEKKEIELKAEEILLTKEMFEDRREKLDDEWKEVKNYQQKVFGFEGLYFLKKKELIEPIQDIIFESVERIAKKNRLQIIFDKSSEPVLLYTNPIHDYTDYVLEDLGLTEKNN